MGWRDIGLGGGGGGADWMKWKPGEKKMLHVLSEEPKSYNNHYFGTIRRGAVCPGEGCPACATGSKDLRARYSHALVVYSYADKACRVWVMNSTTAEQVKNVHDTYKSLERVDLAVSRIGEGLDTKYGVVPLGTKWKEEMMPETIPDMDTLLNPASIENIESMMNGIDPSTEFDPEKLDAAEPQQDSAWDAPAPPPADEEAPSEIAEEAPAPVEEEPEEKPVKKAVPAKPAAPVANERLDLMKKVLHKTSTHPKMKVPGAKEKLIFQVAKAKKTISQLSVDELKKVLVLLK